jgi:hypothetical protein
MASQSKALKEERAIESANANMIAAEGPGLVRQIGEDALVDAMEILVTIELMEAQNIGGVNDRLSDEGAAQGGIVVRNALLSHLVVTVTRAFSLPRANDRHLRRAFEILERNSETRTAFQDNGNALIEAEQFFKNCCEDPRLERIKHMRDKSVAHRGLQRQDIPKPQYGELFAFANNTIDAIEKFAFAIGIANITVRDNIDAKPAAEAFWRPWKDKS